MKTALSQPAVLLWNDVHHVRTSNGQERSAGRDYEALTINEMTDNEAISLSADDDRHSIAAISSQLIDKGACEFFISRGIHLDASGCQSHRQVCYVGL